MGKKRIFRIGAVLVILCSVLLGKNVLAAESEEPIKEPEQLYAQSAVLMDADSGRILFAKNGQEERPMASTTKIMTCILALENGNPDDVVTASKNAASQPPVRLGISEGRQFILRDLLYSLMLESHNDSAVMIAEHVGGSVNGFADMMNAKAMEIGCEHTHFITPNGLDAQDETGVHHTTAEDLARIMRYCIQDSPKREDFLNVTRADVYQFSDCTHVYKYTCTNHNAFLHMMNGVLSGKTGFTNDAGYCYIGAVEQDGKKLIAALLACGWPNHKGYKWADMKTLMNYGFENFEYRETEKIEKCGPLPVENGVPDEGGLCGDATVNTIVIQPESLRILIRKDQKLKVQTKLFGGLEAPVSKGRVVGKLQYLLDDVVIKEVPVYTAQRKEERTFMWCMKQVVGRLVFVIE